MISFLNKSVHLLAYCCIVVLTISRSSLLPGRETFAPNTPDRTNLLRAHNNDFSLFESNIVPPTTELSLPKGTNPPKRKIRVAIYGGSISWGTGLDDREHQRYSHILQGLLSDEYEVINNAAAASGAYGWLVCGLEQADIIISEYRINEGDKHALTEWYNLAIASSKHLIILELWSWKMPPDGIDFVTYETVRNGGFLNRTDVSLVDVAADQNDSWFYNVERYFNYTGADPLKYIQVPKRCYDAARERDDEEKKTMKFCRENFVLELQHGRFPYHYDVAKALQTSIGNIDFHASKDEEEIDRGQRECFGGWGTVDPDVPSWSNVIVENNGFEESNPFTTRMDKISLNSNSVGSSLVLDCPGNDFNAMTIAYIMHGNETESVGFTINGKPHSTFCDSYHESYRLREYTRSKFELPVRIELVSQYNNSAAKYLELTNVGCTQHDPVMSDDKCIR